MKARGLVVFVLVVLAITACESTAAPPSTTPATATAPAPATASSTPAPATAPTACLMAHVCGCNLGCTRIAVDPASLEEGMRATAQTGPYAGTDLTVLKEIDAAGASVFALSDRPHTHPCQLPSPDSRSLMGFVCATKASGPIPARACARCD